MTERELRAQALEYECPECGAKSGHKCGTLRATPDIPNYPPSRNYWETQKHPHDERTTLAWRAHLSLTNG